MRQQASIYTVTKSGQLWDSNKRVMMCIMVNGSCTFHAAPVKSWGCCMAYLDILHSTCGDGHAYSEAPHDDRLCVNLPQRPLRVED